MDPTLIDRLWLLLAAVGGAVIPVALSDSSRGRAVVRVICGTVLAVFLAPAIGKRYVSDSDPEIQAAVAILIGCFGLNLTMIVQGVIETHVEKATKRVVGRFLRGIGK
ncbi:hypothetical protein C8J98_101346 [Luteibacter sp. OK325]|uniref:hypothetical protein n=1 Tax=Luteibacter sp. OK325 TaxID=2135670 RepID=UPI000D3350D5|nr:hypothetical protein [Luteibacter sp. OK325]PTR35084.1 hypothetical protein C8J98_101346 [Luteibacter sp. OK325]